MLIDKESEDFGLFMISCRNMLSMSIKVEVGRLFRRFF